MSLTIDSVTTFAWSTLVHVFISTCYLSFNRLSHTARACHVSKNSSRRAYNYTHNALCAFSTGFFGHTLDKGGLDWLRPSRTSRSVISSPSYSTKVYLLHARKRWFHFCICYTALDALLNRFGYGLDVFAKLFDVLFVKVAQHAFSSANVCYFYLCHDPALSMYKFTLKRKPPDLTGGILRHVLDDQPSVHSPQHSIV